MSVLISFKVPGDVELFTKSLESRADETVAISERAKAAGALHHRFALGPDYVVVHDEWDSVESFQQFFSDPSLQEFIASVGGDTSSPPELLIGEAIDSPDRF